ncbi:hypothetical protein AAC387_Pa03g0365 [Persea americana]
MLSRHLQVPPGIENMANKYGSPSMTDIEDFSSAYCARLDEAEVAGAIPDNYSLEVSSPEVERIVQIPQELDRFKDKPMYVNGCEKNREQAGKGRPLSKKQRERQLQMPFDSLRLVRLYSDC